MVAVRAAPSAFAATENETDPLPLPPVVPSVNQAALLDAVHAQPDGLLIVAVPVPPAAVKLDADDESA